MKDFKEFNIKPVINVFVGDRIKMDRIINKPIIVHDYTIKDSTANEGTEYLTLQIEKEGIKYVTWTGSKYLLQVIEQIPKNDFPFKATIVKDNDYYEFT